MRERMSVKSWATVRGRCFEPFFQQRALSKIGSKEPRIKINSDLFNGTRSRIPTFAQSTIRNDRTRQEAEDIVPSCSQKWFKTRKNRLSDSPPSYRSPGYKRFRSEVLSRFVDWRSWAFLPLLVEVPYKRSPTVVQVSWKGAA